MAYGRYKEIRNERTDGPLGGQSIYSNSPIAFPIDLSPRLDLFFLNLNCWPLLPELSRKPVTVGKKTSLGSTKAPTSDSKVLRYLLRLTAVKNILFNRLMIERRQ